MSENEAIAQNQVQTRAESMVGKKSHGFLDATSVAVLLLVLVIAILPLSFKRFMRWIGYKLK